ncbi:MAG: EpsG family protein [Lachnospiraceae bacterium]|nr:EpsG family protein [Lachnospiraceae bacterium]
MQTYVVYILLLFFVMLFSNLAQRAQKKTYLWLLIFALTFIAGCRAFTVGKDTESYIQIFEYLENDMWDWAHGEIGFKWFSRVFLDVFNNYTLLILFYAFVTNAMIIFRLWDFKKLSSFPWMVVCYYISFYFMTMNIMRHCFAIAIVFYATRYIEQKRYFRFLCFIGLATLFHTSSLIGIGFVALDIFQWRFLNYKQKIFIGIAGFLAPVIVYFILRAVAGYGHYFNTTNEATFGLMIIAKLALYILGLLLFYKIIPNKEGCKDSIELDIYDIRCVKLYYLLGLLLTSTGYFFLYMERIGLPFYLFECVYWGMLVKITDGKEIFSIVLILLLLYLFTTDLISNGQGVLPYIFVWQS